MASISISGWGVSRYYTLDVWESSYDSKANTSVVSWSLSANGAGGTWYDYYLYASVNGTTVFNESGSWSKGSFPAATGSTSGSMTISHGSDGKKTISFYIEGYAYQYSTNSNSGSLTLTNIDRSAPTITASSPSSITINSMNVTASSNVQCSQFAIRYRTGSSWGAWTYWTGNANSHIFSLTGLANNTTYYIQVAGKKSSNDVWGYSGEVSGKTLGASTIASVSNATIGVANDVTVKWTPLNSTFKFILKFSCGSWSYTTGYISPNQTTQYTYTYTVPMEVCDQIVNAPTGTLTVTLTTYTSANAQVGSASNKTATLTVPAAVVPTITSVTLEEATPASGFNLYVKSLSKVKATTVAAGAYSSTIASIVTKVGTLSYTANSSGVATSDILQIYGSVTVETTVTDSRGRTAVDTQTITVYDYFQPTIAMDISINSATNTVVTSVAGSIAAVNNTNAKSLVITRKRLSDDTTTTYTVNPLSDYNYSVAWTQTVADIGTESYEYTAVVTDTKQSVSISGLTAIICISRLAGGRGVTFFEEASKQGFWIHDIEHDITQSEYLELAILLGENYSTAKDYFVGEFCIYNSKAWECNTPIVGGETWTASHWDELGAV